MKTCVTYYVVGLEKPDGSVELLADTLCLGTRKASERAFFAAQRSRIENTNPKWKVYSIKSVCGPVTE